MGNSSQCHCYESSMGSYCDGTCIEKEKARIDENGYMWNMRDLIPMHYIGKKDSNNKDIYEGDINDTDGDLSYISYSEEECSYGLKFLPIEKNDDYYEFCIDWNKLNIIGNIFENSSYTTKDGKLVDELKIESNEIIKF